MENKRIGCQSGKTILVDPNAFDGQNSLSNISVPLEDLSISVQLETNKKARTILTSTGGKNIGNSSEKVTLRFIEGTEINGQRVLTTKYTDLTTTFDEGQDSENLGITNIDIDFNSSYAPLITINFIDVRGSSVFQNEENLSNGKNKYATFFQLPYPIYKLTVKGYYGLPVKYELHMTKFNAKFNSQTGNFEITANFIGYTYAMLSDMLLGYLKAIPYTSIGAEKYKKINDELRAVSKPVILTLDELMEKISKINVTTEKIKATSEGAAQLTNGKSKQEDLEVLKINLLTLGQSIDVNKELTEYPFIVYKTETDAKSSFDKYNTDISSNILIFNNGDGDKKTGVSASIQLKDSDFKSGNFLTYTDLSVELLTISVDPTNNYELEASRIKTLSSKFDQKGKLTTEEFDIKRATLLNVAIKRGFIGAAKFNIIDLSKQYETIQKTDDKLIQMLKELRISLGEELRAKVTETLGIDPSVRNIINIFTTAVEVLLAVLYDVSATAANPNNLARTAQLKKFKEPGSFDIKPSTSSNTSSSSPSGSLTPLYYPWPDYRVNDEVTGLVETYIGGPGILDVPTDVTEIEFINNLLQAFLVSKIRAEQSELDLIQESKNWLPVNPLDTRLFIDTFPYKRINGNTRSEIINLLLIRAFTYIGITNKGLTKPEIQAIANADCDGLLNDIPNDIIVQSLTTLTRDEFLNAKGKINDSEIPLMKYLASSDAYYYNYIYGLSAPSVGYNIASIDDAEGQHILPIDQGFSGKWPSYGDNTSLVVKANSGYHFLTNYTASRNFGKADDGGVYIKIINTKDYDGIAVKDLPSVPSEEKILLLSELKKKPSEFDRTAVGFNQFGGNFGIQEYRVLNYDETGLEKAAFMGIFYQDGNFGSNTYNKSNGLAYKRLTGATTPYDITNSVSYEIAQRDCAIDFIGVCDTAIDNVIVNYDGSNPVHTSYGKNRILLNEYIVNKSDNITYPYINFQVHKDVDDANFGQSNDVAPVSLFGSRLYYEQTSEYAKAILFLHTFPWNGLVQDEATKILTGVYKHKQGVFDANEILNTFGNRAGFISAPKLWVAFIGGLLWRSNAQESGPTDPILFRNNTESFIPTFNVSSIIPTRLQYITSENDLDYSHGPMTFSDEGYKPLDKILLSLPFQAQFELIQAFKDFVVSKDGGDSDWTRVKKQLEVFNGNGSDWKTAWTTLMSNPSALFDETTNLAYHTKKLSKSFVSSTYNAINNGKPVFDSYIVFTPYYGQDKFDYNYFLELKDSSDAVKTLVELFSSEIIIANMSYKPWEIDNIDNFNNREGIFIKNSDMTDYIDAVIARVKPKDGETATDKKKNRENEIFGTDNENIIKLQLYRTCKNLYDKWIGGSASDDIIFQGQNDSRTDVDKALAIKARGNGATPTLIDSFRFVDRAFTDIGDKLIINPVPVGDFLRNNPNSSFYDSVTSLLSANNFDFIALPSFINYKDPDSISSMFKPMSSVDGFKQGTIGPSFVCVYVGQTSKHLDFNSSEHTNDGVDIRCDSNGNITPTLAKDLTGTNAEDYENSVAVFAVNYSQQNQNIFKDITLDQSEFTETAESLQITDEIASKGAENNKTFGGQNLYNVNSVRSYKTEVEMMGNVMIQPMMYFQLNNIPMFHGAYMITHVKHSIKPNFMSTHFTGVRIRNVATPLLDVTELFMSLLDSVESSTVNETKIPFGDTSNLNSGSVIKPTGSKADYLKFVTYDVPESDSLKFQEHDGSIKAKGDSWAMPECGEFMVNLAKKWHAANVSSVGTDVLYVNNFGAYGGGTNKKHGGDGGLHSVGLACDIQPMAKTKQQQRCIVGESNYDQAKNIELIQMAIDLSNSQDKIKLQNVILNDADIINHFSNIKNAGGGKLMISWAGHANHIHMEFDYPPRVINEVKNNIKQNESIVSSGEKGTIIKNTAKFPNETERLNALGKI